MYVSISFFSWSLVNCTTFIPIIWRIITSNKWIQIKYRTIRETVGNLWTKLLYKHKRLYFSFLQQWFQIDRSNYYFFFFPLFYFKIINGFPLNFNNRIKIWKIAVLVLRFEPIFVKITIYEIIKVASVTPVSYIYIYTPPSRLFTSLVEFYFSSSAPLSSANDI